MTVDKRGFRHCVYGGQYGSEGKGCVSEFLIHRTHSPQKRLVVFGDNAPNSGHTNSLGKTRSMPVSAYYADVVVIGPNAVVDFDLLVRETNEIRKVRPDLEVIVHEHAAFLRKEDITQEMNLGLEGRVASTVTGSGAARVNKHLNRAPHLVAKHVREFYRQTISVVDRFRYLELLSREEESDWLFECSQGLLLDVNFGIYPYVTSQTTHPRAAIERNGLGPSAGWRFTGVFRTYPIRTGGNSGPTGGRELRWQDMELSPEIASVTKRTRRVFEFSGSDFLYSLRLVEPEQVAFTHLDYLPSRQDRTPSGFQEWLSHRVTGSPVGLAMSPRAKATRVLAGEAPGVFGIHGTLADMDYAPWQLEQKENL